MTREGGHCLEKGELGMTGQGQKGDIWLRRINFQNVLRGGGRFSDKRAVGGGGFRF